MDYSYRPVCNMTPFQNDIFGYRVQPQKIVINSSKNQLN